MVEQEEKKDNPKQKATPLLNQNPVVIVCPGIHDPHLTDEFIKGLAETDFQGETNPKSKIQNPKSNDTFKNWLVFPTDQYAAYSPYDILNFIDDAMPKRCNDLIGFNLYRKPPLEVPLIFISFSAGVVGAMGAAWIWQQQGGSVQGFFALDGWGVPLFGNFPIYRISHDLFTHWSSGLLGTGKDNFYADPGVAHLDLWRSPQTVQGQWVHHSETGSTQSSTTAALFLVHLLRDHKALMSKSQPF